MIRRLLVLAGAVLLLESFFSQVLTPLVPSYRADLGLTEGAAGILVASYAAGGLLLALPAGWFASRFNPRRAVIVGLLGVGVSSVLFGFATRIELLDGTRFLLGAFGALLWAGGISWMVSAAPTDKRGQYMGVLMAAAVAGELIGSPVAALADEVGTEIVFSAVLVIALGLAALARTIPPVAEADGQPAATALRIVRRGGSRGFPLVLMAVAGPSIATGFIMVVLPFRFDDLGVSAWLLAGAFLAISAIEVVLGPVVGRISDRIGRRRPYLMGMALLLASSVAAGMSGHMAVMVIALVVFAIGAALAFTPSLTMVTDLATTLGMNQGYSSAVSNIGWSASIIIGAAGGGLLIGATGYTVATITVAGLLGVITLVAGASPLPGSTPEGHATAPDNGHRPS